MTVQELIEKLKQMPQDATVGINWNADVDIKIKCIEESELVEECVMINSH